MLKSLHSAPWDLKGNGTPGPPFIASWDPSTRTANTDLYYDDEPAPALPQGFTAGEGAAIPPPPGLTHPDDDLPQVPLPDPVAPPKPPAITYGQPQGEKRFICV